MRAPAAPAEDRTRVTIPSRISLQTGLSWRILAGTLRQTRVLELMDDTTTLGAYLRAERERRDLTLRTISESTKVSLPLLEGLESDDISRWPGGIFRRAFVRSYAEAVGLDPDEVFRRFERQTSRSMTAADRADSLRLKSSRSRRPPGSTAVSCPVEPGPVSRHRGGHGRCAGACLWQRRRRLAAAVAGHPDCRVLRGWRPPHRDQPDGGPPRRRPRRPPVEPLGRVDTTDDASTRCWAPSPHHFLTRSSALAAFRRSRPLLV